MTKLQLLSIACNICRIGYTITLRFVPTDAIRGTKRGRAIMAFDTVKEAESFMALLSRDSKHSKETINGHYHLSLEARSAEIAYFAERRHINHFAGSGASGVHADVPGQASAESAAASPQKADDAQPQGAAGAGTHARRANRDKAPAGPEKPVVTGQAGPDQKVSARIPLSELGKR